MSHKKINVIQRIFVVLVWAIYPLLYIGLFPSLGGRVDNPFVAAFGLIPVLVAGAIFGKPGGLAGGVMMLVLNLALGFYVSRDVEHLFKTNEYIGSMLFVLLGIGAGHLHDIQKRLSTELQERKRIEQVLRNRNNEIQEQKQYFETLFRNSPIAIVTLDINNNISDFNPSFCQLFGFDKNDIRGQKLDDLIVPDEIMVEARDMTLAAAKGQMIHHFGKRQTKSGNNLDVELFGVPVMIEEEQVGTLALYHDLTEQNRLAAETQKLSKAVEQSATPIFITEIDGEITYVNPAFLQVTGFAHDEIIGENPRIFKSGIKSQAYYKNLWQTILAGNNYAMVTPNKRKDGEIWHYDQTIHPLKDDTGKIISFVSTGKDITDQIEAKDALYISEKRFRDLFQNSPVALWEEDFSKVKQTIGKLKESGVTDMYAYLDENPQELEKILSQIKIIDVNQAVLDITSAKSKDELFKNLSKMTTERERVVWKEQFTALSKGATSFEIESSHKTLDGDLVHTHVRVNIAPGYETTWERVFVSQSNITELKKTQTELRVAKKEAEQAAKAKAEFLANMSHEIRTPLNAVVGMSSLLMDTELDKEQSEYINIVRSSSDALLAIINEILDFSKIEAGKLELEKKPFYLRELVESSLDMIAPQMAAKQLDLAYIMDSDIPQKLIGDSTRISQILANFLSNAAKFTDQGEVVVSIFCDRLGGEQYKIHFQVRDTGIGIPPDRLDRLFKSFSQVDASTTRKYGGTGLGLAISKQLTELMGGEIWVESEEGSGSTFNFTIKTKASFGTDYLEPIVEQASLSGKSLLIVDDNQTNRLIVKKYAEKWGMTPTEVESGAAALALVDQGAKFDMAILDYQMPEMDGFSLATNLHAKSDTKKTLLIMLSSMGTYKAEPEVMALFSAFVNKPIKPSQLLDVMVSVMTKKSAQNQKRKITADIAFDPEMGVKFPLDILLVEDYSVNQKVATKLLGKFGYRMDIAENGIDAIQALERQHYDVVFMDIQMPEMDGEEATKVIREKWLEKEHPWIIAMTAHALDGDREHFLSNGMDDYISKPLDVKELFRVLHRIPRSYRKIIPDQKVDETKNHERRNN